MGPLIYADARTTLPTEPSLILPVTVDFVSRPIPYEWLVSVFRTCRQRLQNGQVPFVDWTIQGSSISFADDNECHEMWQSPGVGLFTGTHRWVLTQGQWWLSHSKYYRYLQPLCQRHKWPHSSWRSATVLQHGVWGHISRQWGGSLSLPRRWFHDALSTTWCELLSVIKPPFWQFGCCIYAICWSRLQCIHVVTVVVVVVVDYVYVSISCHCYLI